MSQFAFLQHEWPAVFDSASSAETSVRVEPRATCFYARRTLELAVNWAYKHDADLQLPYQDKLSALIHDPSFKQVAGEGVVQQGPCDQHTRKPRSARPPCRAELGRTDSSA